MSEGREDGVICMELNRFANLCGYFHNAYLTDGVSLNNGYNCRHPEQSEVEEIEGKCFGSCYAWSCPLAYPPDADDLVNYNILTEGEASSEYPDGESSHDHVVVTDVDTIRKLREAGEIGLAVRPYKNEE